MKSNRLLAVIIALVCLCICLSCKNERIIYRNLYYEYDENLMQYGIDSSTMFKDDVKLSKIDYDSLQNVINEVYNATKNLIDDKTLVGDIDDLYLKFKKDSIGWSVSGTFRLPPGHIMIGNAVLSDISTSPSPSPHLKTAS